MDGDNRSILGPVLIAVVVTAVVVGGVIGGVVYMMMDKIFVEREVVTSEVESDEKSGDVVEKEEGEGGDQEKGSKEVVKKTTTKAEVNEALEEKNGSYILRDGRKIDVADIMSQIGPNETLNGVVEGTIVPNELFVATADSKNGAINFYVFTIKQKELSPLATGLKHSPFPIIAGMIDDEIILVREGIDFSPDPCFEGPWFVGANIDLFSLHTFQNDKIKPYEVSDDVKSMYTTNTGACEDI